MRFALLLSAGLLVGTVTTAAADLPADPRDGQLATSDAGELVAWDGGQSRWVDPVTFWESYAGRRGGVTWGRGSEYPPYERVSELDTFLVELEEGPCLMEFFHRRWRRANDVRRWDESFNDYGGCPYVFR